MPNGQLEKPATHQCLFFNVGDPCFVNSHGLVIGFTISNIRQQSFSLYQHICKQKRQSFIPDNKFVCKKHLNQLKAQAGYVHGNTSQCIHGNYSFDTKSLWLVESCFQTNSTNFTINVDELLFTVSTFLLYSFDFCLTNNIFIFYFV